MGAWVGVLGGPPSLQSWLEHGKYPSFFSTKYPHISHPQLDHTESKCDIYAILWGVKG